MTHHLIATAALALTAWAGASVPVAVLVGRSLARRGGTR